MRTLVLLISALACGSASAADTRLTVDFPEFLRQSSAAMALRQSRLVDIDRFNAMAAEDGTKRVRTEQSPGRC